MSQHKLYDVYDDATQVARQIPRYPKSYTRVPASPLIERPLTLSEISGPKDLAGLLHAGPLDLSRSAEGKRAVGQLIWVTGKVCDEDGSPIQGAVLEIWQANSAGKYIHQLDGTDAPLDPNFTGSGQMLTGPDGEYRFVTIKPGAYPWRNHPNAWRPSHIHFSVFGPSFCARLITQMYFPGEPLNAQDRILHSVPDAQARARLIAQPMPMQAVPQTDHLGFCWDVVIRGAQQTPIEQTDTHATNNGITRGIPPWR